MEVVVRFIRFMVLLLQPGERSNQKFWINLLQIFFCTHIYNFSYHTIFCWFVLPVIVYGWQQLLELVQEVLCMQCPPIL